ncbi:hypothetical protein C448_04020 [Halococcus morrhuae DSM 1307]|uniref:DUF4268 domain-containing protein n=1 Tax=Halococcus morrhuae DSM 1307 TaxID=931277 RepID=M0MQY5_HALMO|nr:DUF4268 domain-containing protein [Halococcus morrhuae]EMA48132.1 hypothetical protein C448_04020 [Halococcus morrhuae DSM 1307]
MNESEDPIFEELVPQNVRDYWEHEAHDFTPWLAGTIENEDTSHLEDILGLDLQVVETEKSVGRFNLDILAEVVDDGRQVVIENQLEQSDHDHLGKSLAYAAGIDADIIVWIAPVFNDEHRDAVQWLNQNTREEVDLFAIRLEIWKIGDSPPAIRLNSIEDPSEWKKKAQRSGDEVSDTKELQEEFWTQFRNRIEESSTRLRPRKPRPLHYYSNPIGKAGFHISFVSLLKESKLKIELIIKDDEDAFWKLEDEKEAIKQELGIETEWEEPRETRGGNMRSNIRVTRDADIENRDDWEQYFDWLLEYGECFNDVFRERIQQF